MSTQLQPTTDPEFGTAAESFTAEDAPQTFDPFNTCSCPQMFADKWQNNGDGLEHR
jgi:hypothetical protein